MKLENKISKLLEEHDLVEIMEQIISQAGMAKVLLQISNRLVYKGNRTDKKWTKRAKVIHDLMKQIEREENEKLEGL